MSFQPAFNARLIAEVKKYPCLYNHSKRGSGDTSERMRIWDQIAAAVDSSCSGEFAKKRWLQLRDRYRKELKVAIRQNFSSPVRWCYFSHLSWLDPYLKDNLALAACETLSDSLDFAKNVDLSFVNIKNELDEGIGEDDSSIFESSLDRVLAATQRHESVSPTLENDESGPQSVGTCGDDDRADSGIVDDERELAKDSKDALQILQPPATFSIKEQILARQQSQHNNIGRHLQQVVALDWMNDEDMLYGRIIGLKMKRMDPKKRKRVRAHILSLLEESDSEDDVKCPKLNNVNESESPACDS